VRQRLARSLVVALPVQRQRVRGAAANRAADRPAAAAAAAALVLLPARQRLRQHLAVQGLPHLPHLRVALRR
jgi:hypothetical protein